ncbi:MAG TPA: antitoxin [Thermoanaerobaculia bacterium]
MKEIRTIARRMRITVAEWVRAALRAARPEEAATDAGRKLLALRQATSHSFPTADIEEMLAQIDRGSSDERAVTTKHHVLLARQAKAMVAEQPNHEKR